MTFRLFRREKKPYGWVDPEKATIVGGTDAAWPVRGGRRTVEESLAMRARTRRLREQLRQQQEQQTD